VLVGQPCNQFGRQESGSNEEIKEFARSLKGAKFPLLAKADVNGDNASPLYKFLRNQTPKNRGTAQADEISWNFQKASNTKV
jgi:glutathione peroxidase-family protein